MSDIDINEARAWLERAGVNVPDDWTDEQVTTLQAELSEVDQFEPDVSTNPFSGISGGHSPRG